MAHFPTRPVDRERAEKDLMENIKKATSLEEAAPKQKHVRSGSPVRAAQLTARVDRVQLGLPFVGVHLERPPRPAHPHRRGADVQGHHHRAQAAPGGPSNRTFPASEPD